MSQYTVEKQWKTNKQKNKKDYNVNKGKMPDALNMQTLGTGFQLALHKSCDRVLVLSGIKLIFFISKS